jgi:hypothetical protein
MEEADMKSLSVKQWLVILAHAFVLWALCGAIMFIGMGIWPMGTTLIVHAVGAPIIAAGISLLYFKKFNYTSPLVTAAIFVGFVILVDFFLVAMVINKSFEMFQSFIGTWLPFILIFSATYLTGRLVGKKA